MPSAPPAERHLPSRWQALSFFLKTHALQARRHLIELQARPALHPRDSKLLDAPIAAELRMPLWSQLSPAEFPLTAGKVENLRLAARALHGLEVPADATFSFWRQLGRTSRAKGFTTGRELREGCLVPSIGGGLCQISGLLYQTALKAQLEIVERHAHSRIVPGSTAEQDLDATVFWNYVDLRFRGSFDWRLEVQLDATDLIVRIRAHREEPRLQSLASTLPPKDQRLQSPASPRLHTTGDCLTCNQTSCFRHPGATASHAPGLGHSAFLLDTRWPEFDEWCAGHSRENDHWFLPLDAARWKKANYAWSPPQATKLHHATSVTLLRSLRQRSLPAQGAIRQKALLNADAQLANYYARRISPECRHLVVSMNLLPHLWRLGVLGGRTFDVLADRWPLAELQGILDRAAAANPRSPTLGDFRADPQLLREERAALAAAARLITPHQAIAAHFGDRAWLLDWKIPEVEARKTPPGRRPQLFLPCSALGRKGIHELAAALTGKDIQLLVLGCAREGGDHDPLADTDHQPATLADLSRATALILPAWIEHQPRLALRALAMNIPVIATKACGLPNHPLLTQIPNPNPSEILKAIDSLLKQSRTTEHTAYTE
ncbi:VanW family protein [Haloferula chungangensis]|uniref:VanW family protein n=1 Tax=Haloferula chungangensis TaxID=1048331 RepID=A0ABW2L7M5_9BACT